MEEKDSLSGLSVRVAVRDEVTVSTFSFMIGPRSQGRIPLLYSIRNHLAMHWELTFFPLMRT